MNNTQGEKMYYAFLSAGIFLVLIAVITKRISDLEAKMKNMEHEIYRLKLR